MAIAPVSRALEKLGGKARTADGREQGWSCDHRIKAIWSLMLSSNAIPNPSELEQTINNIPGVLENGIFIDVTG